MLLLILHLRHGVWSALQSLGTLRPSWSPIIYTLGGLVGLGIGLGFIAMPLAIYFGII
jgi:succinate dehydrogenase / fumarate reductase cytochrome b subunit